MKTKKGGFMGNDDNLIETIQQMYKDGKLTSEISINLILQVCLELYKGQDKINANFERHDDVVRVLTGQVEENKKNLENIKKDLEVINKNSFSLWIGRHTVLSKILLIVFIILINTHDIVTGYLLALLGFKAP